MMLTGFEIRYFFADSDKEWFSNTSATIQCGEKDDTARYESLSTYIPPFIWAPSIEMACLLVKSKGWIVYPFKHEDGTFTVWAWAEGLLIKITWEMPPMNEDERPMYDITFMEFSPLTFKKEYTSDDYRSTIYRPNLRQMMIPICKKVELVNRSYPMD